MKVPVLVPFLFLSALALGQVPDPNGGLELNGEPPSTKAPAIDFPGEGPLFDEYHDIAKDLRCPTCTGLSVLESEAKFSEQIKEIVKEKVKEGKHKEEIFKYFTERYGPWILRAPPKEGFNAIAWLFPIGILLLGPVFVWFFVWRKRKVVSTQGVRPAEAIIKEMTHELELLRSGRRT